MKNLTTSEKIYALLAFMIAAPISIEIVSFDSGFQTFGERLFAAFFIIILPSIIAKYLMDNGKSFLKWYVIGAYSAGVFSGIYALYIFMKQSKENQERNLNSFGDYLFNNKKKEKKESPEERKDRLIKKYGELNGLRIFNGEISESKHKQLLRQEKKENERKELIKKYGEVYGLKVFEGQIAEKSIKKLIRLHKKYGEKIGDKIFNKKLFIGMTNQMLIDAYGNPSDRKETVTKNKTIRKCYFLPRTTQQKTIVYALEVVLEDGKVVKWKEVE